MLRTIRDAFAVSWYFVTKLFTQNSTAKAKPHTTGDGESVREPQIRNTAKPGEPIYDSRNQDWE